MFVEDVLEYTVGVPTDILEEEAWCTYISFEVVCA